VGFDRSTRRSHAARFEFHCRYWRFIAIPRRLEIAQALGGKAGRPGRIQQLLAGRRKPKRSIGLHSGRFVAIDRRESIIMKAKVTVTLKSGILDPQGKAIEGALRSLGIAGVASVRQGKLFDIEIAEGDPAAAEAKLKEAAERLLANTVIENYDVKIID
jgi:phosphoribosylformylglycinamidine synthase subunit PurS